MKNDTTHLSEDQFLKCLADESGSPAQLRVHLERCRTCRERFYAVQRELTALKRIADRCIPPFHHQPVSANPTGRWRTSFTARPVFAVTLLVILTLAGWALLKHHGPGGQEALITAEMAQDRVFLLEIESLEERALRPPGIRFNEETDYGFSQAFIDYIAPLEKSYTGSGLLDNPRRKQPSAKESLT